MAEAEPANDRGVVKNFKVSGVERDSVRIDQLVKDDETDVTEIAVTDATEVIGTKGIVKIHETIAWFNYQAKGIKEVKWNLAQHQASEVDDGWAGLLTCLQDKFNEAYPEEGPYQHWGHPHEFIARGAIQEHLRLYNAGEYAGAGWHAGPHLKLFNAGHLLFSTVYPHASGMSICMINYMENQKWYPNRGFYTSMQSLKDYYPINFKANAEDGWKPVFNAQAPFSGFALQWPYTAEKPTYDEAGEMIGTKPEVCGDWVLPFHMWNANLDVEQYPVLAENLTQANLAQNPATKIKVSEQFMKTQKYDFAGNIKYKLTKAEISKESFDGHHDIFIMGESNKEIIVGAKFREGIMLVNFATKEYPKGQGRRPQMNKANAYRVKQFFGGLIAKGIVTTFGGDATADMFKA